MMPVFQPGQNVPPLIVGMRCPACGQMGSFHGVPNLLDAAWAEQGGVVQVGVRICPDSQCHHIVFVVLRRGVLEESYPPEVLDFDASGLPANIASSLNEAVQCHAVGAYRASALMVRRVLEELCGERGAKGANLKARLEALQGATLLPKELLEAADELRLLGNDAAHIDAQLYDTVGHDEATVAIELAKELLKAVYQYKDLVTRLRSLRGST